MIRIAGILIAFLVSNSLIAQNLMDDLGAVSTILDTAKSVKIQVVCKIYTQKGGELVNTLNTGMCKKGKLSVSSLDNMDIFDNDTYGVYINNEEKSIKVISKAKHTTRLKATDDKSINQFVGWMKNQQKKVAFTSKLVSEVDGIRTYSITDMEDLKELTIDIDVKNHTLKKISYEFSESSKQKQRYMVLNYSKFLVNSKDIHLDQQDYYIYQSGKFSPGNKYKSYSITTDL